MMKRSRSFFSGLFAACCLLLSGCAINSQPPAIRYDLGPPSSMPASKVLLSDMPVLVVSRVNAPDWLDNTMMYYRLTHVNDQQIRFYTLSRWNMPPVRLFRDRLQSRIGLAEGVVGSERIPQAEQLRLIVYVEDFSQYFQDDSNSEGRIALRVSIVGKNGFVAQKRFFHAVQAPTPDAPGGVQALSVATDEAITEILLWIAENAKKGESR